MMLIVRRYELTAKDDRAEALLASLELLATWLMRRDGCKRVEIERSAIDERVLIFSEHWRDEGARLAAGLEINRALLERIASDSQHMRDTRSEQVRIFNRQGCSASESVPA